MDRCCFIVVVVVLFLGNVTGNTHDSKRLFDDLLRKHRYNRSLRPVANSSHAVTVKVGLKFTQLIDVDEKNEIMTTNMWVIQSWRDHNLQWDPEEYGGVTTIFVPSDAIWLPDLVLYNNADGDFNMTYMTKVTVTYNGKVLWKPPAILKSYCDISVMHFPFDEQTCKLKLGFWTYDGYQVDIRHIWLEKYNLDELDYVEKAIDIDELYPHVEWDILKVSGQKNVKLYPCCQEPYPDITFKIVIRRKFLFFLVNMMIPCGALSLLTCLVFYLPCDCNEKISLSISILLSLSLFQLLLMDSVPATSMSIPLMAKFICFTNFLVALSVGSSVCVLTTRYRSLSTHDMPDLVRKIFLQMLPRLLCMGLPVARIRQSLLERDEFNDYSALEQCGNILDDDGVDNVTVTHNFIGVDVIRDNTGQCIACQHRKTRNYPGQARKAMEGVAFIAKHLHEDDDGKKVKDEWRYVALVVDRILLCVFLTLCSLVGSSLVLSAPSLHDAAHPLLVGKDLNTNK